jgi:hypothetical protein
MAGTAGDVLSEQRHPRQSNLSPAGVSLFDAAVDWAAAGVVGNPT